MGKAISNMGQRAYANVTALVGNMKSLRESLGHVKDEQGKWTDAMGRNTDGLSMFQAAIGAAVDDQGRLVDAQDRLIDGMKDADVALGRYIDTEGRLRDSQDRIIDGLNAQQKAAGLYKDELGNLYDAQNNVIKAADAANQTHGITNREALRAAKGLGQLTATMSLYTGNTNPAVKASVALAAGLQAGTMAMNAAASVTRVVNALRTVEVGKLWATFTAQMALNGATGNLVGLAAGVAAGAAAAAIAYNAMSQEAEGAAESVGRLNDAASGGQSIQETMDAIAARHEPIKSEFEKTNAKLEEEIAALKDYSKRVSNLFAEKESSLLNAVNPFAADMRAERDRADALLEKVQQEQRDLLAEEEKRASGFYERKKEREEAEKWIADQAKRGMAETQKIEQELIRAQKALTDEIDGAAEVVGQLQTKYEEAVRKEEEAARKIRFDGMEDIIKKGNEAAKTAADKQRELADEYEKRLKKLQELETGGDITSQELAHAQKYLADELKKQADALTETPWDKGFKAMFELRVPLEERIADAFDAIEEAGKKMGANADEIMKMQEDEQERIKKLYGIKEQREEENRQKEKEKTGPAGGSFALAGSVEAYRISTASEQAKTTKAIEKGFSEMKNEMRTIKSNQEDLIDKIETE